MDALGNHQQGDNLTLLEDILPLTISCLMTNQEPINSNCKNKER